MLLVKEMITRLVVHLTIKEKENKIAIDLIKQKAFDVYPGASRLCL